MKTWGYILEGPHRPDLTKQLETLQFYGVDEIKTDKIERGKPGPGSGKRQLFERNKLLHEVQSGDRIIVSNAYCLGISSHDVTWFIGTLAEHGISLLVCGETHHIKPGQDASKLIGEVARQQNIAHVAACRERKAKKNRTMNNGRTNS